MNSINSNARDNLNHAVVIVGWDDNYDKSNFLQKPKIMVPSSFEIAGELMIMDITGYLMRINQLYQHIQFKIMKKQHQMREFII